MIDVVRRNLSDLLHLFVLPLLICALPWPTGFAVLRRLARSDWGMPGHAERAWSVAREHAAIVDPQDWQWKFRLLRRLETVDTFLVILRSRAWWRRRIRQRGTFAALPSGGVLLTYHWGGGSWVWPILHEAGVPAHFIARRPVARDLGESRVALWYGRFRVRALRRIGCLGPLYVGESAGRISAELATGRCVVGMLDLPAAHGQRTHRGPLLDRMARVPNGLARLAATHGATVTLFSCSFDVDTGDRELRIESIAADDVETISAAYLRHLDRCLHEESAFWQMWPSAGAVIESAGDAATPTTPA